eukprot:GFKZ01006337.1.p1 GENE.GFKZ01006337.1~~GFKZ01006337.1.p1  ORF type:complete len:343 (-),score=30.09 GFKZ01006337.1:376-1404(-)
MVDIEEDPMLWLREFVTGLISLVFVNMLTGVITVLIIHSGLRPRSKLPVLLCGIFLLIVLSSFCFNPKTHIVGSIVGGVSMGFTSPLQAAAWLQRKLEDPTFPISDLEIIFRIAIPAAVPSKRRPPESPVTQTLRGLVYLTLASSTHHWFDTAIDHGGIRLDVMGILFVLFTTTGALNLTSATLGFLGFPSPSPFQRPLLSPSMANFWGSRWNAPVSDSLRLAIYDPLTKARGWSKAAASMMCFLASGIAHECLLFYCGVRDSRMEWLLFFVSSGVLTLVEKKAQLLLGSDVMKRFLAVAVFGVSLHFGFFPVMVRTGMAKVGVKGLGTGPFLLKHVVRTYF